MKLILIEDEKKEQDKFKKLAEKMNDVTFVKITNSTEEGIKCLKENDIDGVILDLELNSGTGNGFEFLEKLKITKLSKIPKIVVTTNVYSDSVYDYLHQNKVDFIFYKKQENYNVENVINTLLLLNNYTNTAKINADYTAGENPVSDSDVIETLGIAVFSGDKLVGELTGLDSICHLIINNDFKQCTLSIPNPYEKNNYIDLLITSTKKTKCSVDIINNSPLISIDVYLIGYGLSLDSNTYYNTEESLNEIKNYAEKYIQNKLENYLYTTSLAYNSDISGFGKYAVKNYLTLDEWKKADWLANYKNCFFNVNVELTLKSGSLFGES